MKRNSHNAQGFFDDKLTKQRQDWKICLDVGMPAAGLWDVADNLPFICCLDGFNQFPNPNLLPDFCATFVEYFEACAKSSHRLACLMARGMGLPDDDPFIEYLQQPHSSYLHMNYYPPCAINEAQKGEKPIQTSDRADQAATDTTQQQQQTQRRVTLSLLLTTTLLG